MGAACKGICLNLEREKIPNGEKYQSGLKRCSWCDIWLETDDVRCPCCKDA